MSSHDRDASAVISGLAKAGFTQNKWTNYAANQVKDIIDSFLDQTLVESLAEKVIERKFTEDEVKRIIITFVNDLCDIQWDPYVTDVLHVKMDEIFMSDERVSDMIRDSVFCMMEKHCLGLILPHVKTFIMEFMKADMQLSKSSSVTKKSVSESIQGFMKEEKKDIKKTVSESIQGFLNEEKKNIKKSLSLKQAEIESQIASLTVEIRDAEKRLMNASSVTSTTRHASSLMRDEQPSSANKAHSLKRQRRDADASEFQLSEPDILDLDEWLEELKLQNSPEKMNGCFSPWKQARDSKGARLFREGERFLKSVSQTLEEEIASIQQDVYDLFKRRVRYLYRDFSRVYKLSR